MYSANLCGIAHTVYVLMQYPDLGPPRKTSACSFLCRVMVGALDGFSRAPFLVRVICTCYEVVLISVPFGPSGPLGPGPIGAHWPDWAQDSFGPIGSI